MQGIRAATLTDGVNTWIVIEWQVDVFGTNSNRHFQVWLGIDATQDISFAYDPAALPADPAGQDFLVGAENEVGQGDVTSFLPTERPGGHVHRPHAGRHDDVRRDDQGRQEGHLRRDDGDGGVGRARNDDRPHSGHRPETVGTVR